jgi:Hypervirulence associated proteins TUDOR domain
MSSASFKVNDKVAWKWLGGIVQGVVKEIYFESVVKVIKGKNIKRNGSKEKPAYLVQSEAGNFALKLQTELFKQAPSRFKK